MYLSAVHLQLIKEILIYLNFIYESEDGRPSICYLSNVQAQPNIQVYNKETEIEVVDRFSG